MITKHIGDAQKFFDALGGAHDALLLRLEWSCVQRRLQLDLDDLCSNFEGLPEYAGRVEGYFVMHDVVEVVLESDPGSDQPMVYDVAAARSSVDSIALIWKMAPSGRLEVACRSITVSGSDLTKLPQAAIEQLS